MCADRIPTEVASNGKLHMRVFRFNRDNSVIIGSEYIPNVLSLIRAITSLEGITMVQVHGTSQQKFAWIQIGRTYFYSILHMTWLQLRHNFGATTETETDILHLVDNLSKLDTSVLPDSIASEIMRITIPAFLRRNQVTYFPCVRSGLLLSELFTASATGNRTRHVQITTEYKQIPSVRISQNMTWLLCNRHSIPTDRSITNSVLCALLNGSFEPTDFIINDGVLNEEQLFNLLCTNPVLAIPPRCQPQTYARAFDYIDADNLSRPVNSRDNEPIIEGLSPAWLEPQIDPTSFDVCRATAGIFCAFATSTTSYAQFELPTATINFDELTEYASDFGNAPQPLVINYDADYWLAAISTRGTGSA